NPSASSSACHVQSPTPRLCSSVHPRTPAPSLLALISSGSPAHLVCVPPCFSAHLLQSLALANSGSPASDLRSTSGETPWPWTL
ncbi:hypothetical protein NQZ68_015990, partial [Dissostichus eleginoides]